MPFINKFLGGAKIFQTLGNVAFIADKGFSWVLNIGSGLASTPGKIVAGIGVIVGGIDSYVTRYGNMQRPTNIPEPQNLDNLSTSKKAVRYVCTGATYGYMAYSGAGGFLSAFSLSKLVAMLMKPVCELFQEECSDKLDDAAWKDVLVFGAAGILLLSTIFSYKKYNLMKMKNEYIPNLVTGKWKEYSLPTYLKAGPNILLGAALTKLQNDHTADLFSETVLERISPAFKIPGVAKIVFTTLGVTFTVFSSALMTIPAVGKFKNSTKFENYKDTLPGWWKMRKPIYASFVGNSAIYGFGNAASIALGIHSFFGLNPLNVSVVVGSSFCGIVGAYITFLLDYEALRNELKALDEELQLQELRLEVTNSTKDITKLLLAPETPLSQNKKQPAVKNKETKEHKGEKTKLLATSPTQKIAYGTLYHVAQPSRKEASEIDKQFIPVPIIESDTDFLAELDALESQLPPSNVGHRTISINAPVHVSVSTRTQSKRSP